MKPTKDQLFKRQITLSEIGKIGQQKLQNASVVVVGCGGLGGPIAVHLATSGIGKLHLIDFDTIDLSNLHRQVYFSLEDVGKYKAATLAKFIEKRAPFTQVKHTLDPIVKSNVFDLISEADIVVDGTDSLPTKYLLNDACVLKNKAFVYGSLYKYDGYVSSFNIAQAAGAYSANLRDAFPTMATDVPNCEAAGTLNAIVSFIAAQQVNEVLKLVLEIGKPLVNQVLIYNSLQNSQLKMKLTNQVSKAAIKELFLKESYFDASCQVQKSDWLISAKKLKQLISDPKRRKSIQIIAVLENLKTPFEVDQTIPFFTAAIEDFKIGNNKAYVLVCQKGMTSYSATKKLKESFPTATILSLAGGINNY